MGIRGVIFDMDGTIVDVCYDWARIKADLGSQGQPILAYLGSLKEPERTRKRTILERYEEEATQKAQLKEGIPEFLEFLGKNRIKTALVTNNSRKNVSFLLQKFRLDFDCVLSRESGLWKPSGAPFLSVLERLKLEKTDCCVVGDSHFDIRAALEAGIPRIFMLNECEKTFSDPEVEVFASVADLQKRIATLL